MEDSKPQRSIKFSYSFGQISKGGYRHFQGLFFAYGTNGFIFVLLGLSMIVKYK